METKPTVGRCVHYNPHPHEGTGPWAGTVARVWTDTCVNLGLLDGNGGPLARTSVMYDADGAKPGTWRWPPRS